MTGLDAMMIDLPQEWLEEIRNILAEYLPGAEVLAYGSRVVGGAHEGSDLDLVARRADDQSKPVENLDAAREAFIESDIPILVEIHDWTRLPDAFKREIESRHEIVQSLN
jgi:predicted nucleotidyltransferase